MSETKVKAHMTSGPWHAAGYHVVLTGGTVVASMHPQSSITQMETDATAIAALPDLILACQYALEVMDKSAAVPIEAALRKAGVL